MRARRPTVCPECGSDDLQPVERRERFAYWFSYGRGGCTVRCNSCGAADSGFGILYAPSPPRGRATELARTASRVFTAVCTNRRRESVPRFYATIGGAALAPAALIAWLAPRRRWLALLGLPAAVMIGGFAWSLASALDRRGRRDIARHLDPAAGIARALADEDARIRSAAPGFTLLEPAHWDGEILLGGSSYRTPPDGPDEVTEVMVTADHGPRPHGRQRPYAARALTLRTSNERFQFPEDHLPVELASLEREAHPDRDPPPVGDDREELERWFAAMRVAENRRAEQMAGRWRTASIIVDDAPVTIRLIEGDGAAIARFDLDGQHVRIDAVGVTVDGLALKRVIDVEPLLAAMRDRRSEMFTR